MKKHESARMSGRPAVSAALAALLAAPLAAGAWAGCGGGQKTGATQAEAAGGGGDGDPRYRRASAPDVGEDEDDGLEVEGLLGRLDNYDIQQGLRPHARDLDRCFTATRGKRRYLGGQVELAFVVGADGSVDTVHVTRSNLGAWPAERCLLEVSRGMRFAEPRGGPRAEFSVPLEFSALGGVTEWDEGRGRAEVVDRASELEACAEAGAAPGQAWITAYVGTRGQVQSVGFASTGGPVDEAWATCAEETILGWTLSDPQGRTARVGFAYPVEAM